MKTLNPQIKTFFLLLFVFSGLVGCSSDDDNVIDNDDKDDNLIEGLASAKIEVGDETIEFSAKSENNFAGIIKTKMGDQEQEVKHLIIIMNDEDSKVSIISQALPAPSSPTNYDLSKVGLNGGDNLFSTNVVLENNSSNESRVYGMGSYQKEDDIIVQSEGSFKITSISSDNIKGTFNMTLYNSYVQNNAIEAEKLVVTNGEFDLPIIEVDEDDLGDFNFY